MRELNEEKFDNFDPLRESSRGSVAIFDKRDGSLPNLTAGFEN
jgi:hypothetical protein